MCLALPRRCITSIYPPREGTPFWTKEEKSAVCKSKLWFRGPFHGPSMTAGVSQKFDVPVMPDLPCLSISILTRCESCLLSFCRARTVRNGDTSSFLAGGINASIPCSSSFPRAAFPLGRGAIAVFAPFLREMEPTNQRMSLTCQGPMQPQPMQRSFHLPPRTRSSTSNVLPTFEKRTSPAKPSAFPVM